jgi:hypothetical protein
VYRRDGGTVRADDERRVEGYLVRFSHDSQLAKYELEGREKLALGDDVLTIYIHVPMEGQTLKRDRKPIGSLNWLGANELDGVHVADLVVFTRVLKNGALFGDPLR